LENLVGAESQTQPLRFSTKNRGNLLNNKFLFRAEGIIIKKQSIIDLIFFAVVAGAAFCRLEHQISNAILAQNFGSYLETEIRTDSDTN